ncbi:MAG: ASKHA domain-containing protein [Candidatus Omnitrophica bacterium]|nr:ASKHA domain-containing protein [Candidatus Omnitrophota bacterium]
MGRIFFPQFKKGKSGFKVHPGLSILDYIRDNGLEIHAECGGHGICGKCVVRVDTGSGNLNELTVAERKFPLNERERLACQARVIRDEHDIVVFIKDFGTYEILKYGMEREIPLSPCCLKRGNCVFYGKEKLAEYQGKIYGLAIDVGTTTLVFDLVDLETGNILATIARTNPQISYGNDVISRIEYTLIDRGNARYLPVEQRRSRLKQLQKAVVEGINSGLKELSTEMNEAVGQFIYDVVVVGNSTMRNIFLGLDVSSLGLKPFEPVHPEPITVAPEEIGLSVNPQARIYGAPLIGGHVGADILADILASEMYKQEELSLMVDIGTNGELVLGNKHRLITASCAAGGAFEGNAVSCGTGAIEGAIKEIRLLNGKAIYSTIGNKHPVGVCGSGLIDLLAELLRRGLMNSKARIESDFYITPELKITQQDIFQLITSKSAMKTGTEILLAYYPAREDELRRIYLSGGFGNFIDTANAMVIGLLPRVPEERVVKIGNGALEGAREMLLCLECRQMAEKIARQVVHVRTNELENDFDYLIARNMYFYDQEQ